MKKTIFLLLLFLSANTAHSQIWLEGFALHSSPLTAWGASGDVVLDVEGFEPVTVPIKDLFKLVSAPSFGGGVNFKYASDQLIVGMEVSYVAYKANSQLLDLTIFRLGPAVDYFFFPMSSFHPYVGAELSLGLGKVKFNGEITERPRLSKSYLGFGPRAGLVYMLNEKIALRMGTKYIYLKTLPSFDVSLGLAFNIGDF